MIRIKFCGFTREQDVLAAAAAGAWAVGFVFVKKSKRYIRPEQAAPLVTLARQHGLLTVALFADQPATDVFDIQQLIKADVLQFHGQESAVYCAQFNRPYWKAIPMLAVNDWQDYAAQYASADAFLLDAFGGQQSGGSGRSFAWFRIPESWQGKVILAGGIDASNIEQAISQTGTQFIDTSSGIEATPGVKSKEKMLAMTARVRNADREPV
jgi:phosphoribosylanthranilate isomerase